MRARMAVDRARYLRQILLPGVGEAGQARVGCGACVVPAGEAGQIAARYALRAGFGEIVSGDPPRHELSCANPVASVALEGAWAALVGFRLTARR